MKMVITCSNLFAHIMYYFIFIIRKVEMLMGTSTMAWCKYGKMVFPTSRNATKHTLLALGSDHMARDSVK